MYDVVLIRYGEIGLKGKNRPAFEKRLVENIQRSVADIGPFQVAREYGRMVIDLQNSDEEKTRRLLRRLGSVFGIVSVSPAIRSSLSEEGIIAAAKDLVSAKVSEGGTKEITFKVDARRPNKRFPLKTPEINARVGGGLLRSFSQLKVDVHHPEMTVFVEVRDQAAYVYAEVIDGPGGLPVGSSSSGLLLLSGGIDSPVAGWLAMKRGVALQAVHFHSPPFTSERSKEKVLDLAAILARCSGASIPVHVVHFTEIQGAIRKAAPAAMGVTLMRRMMLRIAARIAKQEHIPALITGESVGQVASQTLESMAAINEVTHMPIIRPVVTMDKAEIIQLAEEIGTYDISVLPYEDCCTIFIPEHPETKPRLERLHKAEEQLDIDGLIEEAMRRIERLEIFGRLSQAAAPAGRA